MADARLEAVFREVPKESLDADTAVCFVLDEELRLIYCNPAWDRFAADNGAPHLNREALVGTPILSFLSGEFLGYYQSLFGNALARKKPIEHDFHCSSAQVERLMRMSVYSLRKTPAILVACSLRVEQPHADIPAEPSSLYRDGNGFIVMCGNCRRTRRAGVKPDTWDWIPEYVSNMPSLVSHGLCNLCCDYYYYQEFL